MFVYLDESGDCGFKFRQGSSQYFIVALVISSEAELIDRRVREFRTSIGYRETHEFKFYKADHRRRCEFLGMVSSLPVRVRLLILDKTLITQPQMQKRESFYGFVLKMVLERAFETINGATLVVDRVDKQRKNQQTLTSHLKKARTDAGKSVELLKVKHQDSRSHGGLQVADMVAGAAMAAYKGADRQYLELFRQRIEDEWVWRPLAAV